MRVCVCVCPHPRLLITSGVIWRDMNLIQLVKQILQLLYGNDRAVSPFYALNLLVAWRILPVVRNVPNNIYN